jgi:nucleoside-diphosphate-sugar epimerase
MSITNVALIGGTGTLGAPVLKALKASEFNVFVVNRQTPDPYIRARKSSQYLMI